MRNQAPPVRAAVDLLVRSRDVNLTARGCSGGPASVADQLQLWESWWAHRDAIDWSPDRVPAAREILDAGLLREIEVAVAKDPEVLTLGDRRPNWIREVTPDGVWVETERSRVAGALPSSSRRG